MLDDAGLTKGFEVVSYDHPFRSDFKHANLPEGLTVAELVVRAKIDPKFLPDIQVVISKGTNQSILPMDMWHRVRPKEGSHVLITPRVQAPVLGAVLAAALPAVAGWAAGALFAVGTLAYSLAFAAFTIVGSLLINALIPPSAPPAPASGDFNFSITGISNAEARYGVYPTVLGRHQMYPPKTAKGYTEGEGEDIYYRGRFTFGYGPVALETLKIGTTPIWEFEGVELEFLNVDKPRTLAHMPELDALVTEVYSQNEVPNFSIYRAGYTPTVFEAVQEWSGVYEIEANSLAKSFALRFSAQEKIAWAGDPENKPPNVGWQEAGGFSLTVKSRPLNSETWTVVDTITRPDGGKTAWQTTAIDTSQALVFRVEIAGGDVDRVRILESNIEFADGAHIGGWRHGGDRMSLYPDDVAEEPYSVLLSEDVAIVRETRDRAISAEVDVTYQGLVWFDGDGNPTPWTVDVKYRYREFGAANWIDAGTMTHEGATTSPLRFSKSFHFPREGKYEIELTRLTAEPGLETIRDDAYLSAIRSTQAGALPSHGGRARIAEVAVRLKASDQLNKQLESLNGIVQQLAPVWDGTEWGPHEPVRHPAWIYAHALTGPSLKRPVARDRLQPDDLKAWADEESHWTCDAVIDQPATVGEIVDMICAAGRARRTLRDMKYSVIRDGAAGPVVQQFSPRNSWGFQGVRQFPKELHGLRVKCISERMEWQEDEVIVYADGYDATTATELEELPLRGVVLSKDDATGGNAWRLGRYHLAQSILRPEEFTWQADIDHLRVNLGDKVRLVHDVPLIGVGVGWIKSLTSSGDNLTHLVLDEFMSLAGGPYRLRHRAADGSETLFHANPPASNDGIWTVTDVIGAAGIAEGDQVLVEEMGQDSMELLIKSVRHSGDMTATLTGVPAAPAVLQADQGTIPDYEPILTNVTPREVLRPSVPVITKAFVVVQGAPVVVTARIKIAEYDRFDSEKFRVKVIDPSAVTTPYGPFSEGEFEVPLSATGIYSIEVRRENRAGLVSDPAIAEVELATAMLQPGTPGSANGDIAGNHVTLSWATDDPKAHFYEIRFLADGVPGGWADATPVAQNITSDTATVPAQAGTYYVAGVSQLGQQSETPAEVTLLPSQISPDVSQVYAETKAAHDALVGDFVGNLEDGFDGQREDILSISGHGNIVHTTDATGGVGDWFDTGENADVPAHAPVGAKSLDFLDGAREKPGRLGNPNGRTYRITAWVKSNAVNNQWCLREASTGAALSTFGSIGDTGGAWIKGSWEITGNVDALNFCPAIDVTVSGTDEILAYDVRFEDITEAADIRQTVYTIAETDFALAALETALNVSIGSNSGDITNIMGLTVSPLSALGVFLTEMNVDVNGNSSWYSQTVSTLATIEGNMAASYVLGVGAGGASAGLELHASADIAGGPVSSVKIAADALIIGRGNNLLTNTNFANGVADWSFAAGSSQSTETTMSLRPPNATYAGKTYPTLMAFQDGAGATGIADIYYTPQTYGATVSPGLPVKEGQWLETHVLGSVERCTAPIVIYYYNASGGYVGDSGTLDTINTLGDISDPSQWDQFGGFHQVPAGAAYATVDYRKGATTSGTSSYIFLHEPYLGITHEGATEFSAYAHGGVTMITGDGIMANAITAEKIDVADLSTISASFGDATFSDYIQSVAVNGDGDPLVKIDFTTGEATFLNVTEMNPEAIQASGTAGGLVVLTLGSPWQTFRTHTIIGGGYERQVFIKGKLQAHSSGDYYTEARVYRNVKTAGTWNGWELMELFDGVPETDPKWTPFTFHEVIPDCEEVDYAIQVRLQGPSIPGGGVANTDLDFQPGIHWQELYSPSVD